MRERRLAGLFPQLLLDVHDELIVDLFAGGGGASLGIEMATGRQVDVAVNHDAAAVALHQANHPQTRHLVSDVFEVDPREVTQGRPVGLLWASPDCTDHSKAKGGKPMRDASRKRRALAWVVTRWAGQVRPRVICLENVEEFAQWGPLVGKPGELHRCPRRRGRTFRRWVRSLEVLGYVVEWRELRACDYGAPTIRKRLFVIARCDERPIVWPEPTHGPGLRPYRTAADCIDWSVPMLSIFATRTEARAWGKAHGQATPIRPLAAATMRRIARGVQRFVLDNPRPFIVHMQHQNRPTGLDEPLQTVTTQGNKFNIAAPLLATLNHGGGRDHAPRGLEEPLRTVAASRDAHALVSPFLVPRYGERDGQEPRTRSIEEPAPVVVPTGNGGSLVAAHLSTYYGEKRAGDGRGAELPEPLATQTTENRHALVAAFLARHWGGMVGKELDGPHPTVLTKGAQDQLVAASLTKLRGTSSDADPADPLHTVSAGGTHHGVVAAHLFANYSNDSGAGRATSLEEPVRTVTGTQRHGVVATFLSRFNGQGTGQQADSPALTLPTKDRLGLVTVQLEGVPYIIADIAMRMLQPRELYRAQGFPDSYRIDRGSSGRVFTKGEQVRMVGNSVCPPVAAALVRANVPELRARDEVAA